MAFRGSTIEGRIFVTTRLVSEDWLSSDVPEGEILYEYTGHTYGCVTPAGIACSYYEGETPFMEIPKDALREI